MIGILNHHETALFPLDRDADLFLSKLCSALGLRTWYHLPSLVEHTGGGISTLEHPNFAAFEAVGFQKELGSAAGDLAELHHHDPPLVSCLMPTQDRPEFARQAIEAFRAQDYPNRELVVIECGDCGIRGEIEADPQMLYFNVVPYLTLGARRNLASRMARGSLLSLWDDDDWHSPRRLSTQLEPILAGRAELSALGNPMHYDARRNVHYRAANDSVTARFYHFGIHTGTLAFKRELMRDEFMFPDIMRGDDTILARKFLAARARLERIPDGDLYLYVQHGTNTWPLEMDEQHAGSGEWCFCEGLPKFLPPGARSFYEELSRKAGQDTRSPSPSHADGA